MFCPLYESGRQSSTEYPKPSVFLKFPSFSNLAAEDNESNCRACNAHGSPWRIILRCMKQWAFREYQRREHNRFSRELFPVKLDIDDNALSGGIAQEVNEVAVLQIKNHLGMCSRMAGVGIPVEKAL
jgi:hypothetical protein